MVAGQVFPRRELSVPGGRRKKSTFLGINKNLTIKHFKVSGEGVVGIRPLLTPENFYVPECPLNWMFIPLPHVTVTFSGIKITFLLLTKCWH